MTQHASSSSSPPPPGLEPTHAERVRTLLVTERIGALATHSVHHAGFPFASVMPYALTADGAPIFLISNMAIHTKNVVADSRASLLVVQSGSESDPLGSPRATLLGNVVRVDATDEIRAAYLERHPSSKYWIDFSDFGFFRLDVADVYYVGGFGVMGWVTADDYRTAEADPLAESAAGILEHMNADHADALRAITRHFGGLAAEEATMVSCDRLGFVVRARTKEGMKGARIQFPEPIATREDARRVLVAMTRAARGH
ncbi:MAG: HugZ family pyridoxamine 5'-phosphate oxidase [Thermoanaerobaculia bacterium]